MNELNYNPQNKTFKLLSIDGGGMRGIIPLMMLIHLEQAHGKKSQELFNMVAGTSTGAIIAAGLGLGLSAQEIMQLAYAPDGLLPKAFGRSGLAPILRFLTNGLRFLYPLKPFVAAFRELVNDKRIAELGTDIRDYNGKNLPPLTNSQNEPLGAQFIVLLTAKDLRTGNTYFIINAGKGAKQFQNYPVLGAVAGSGAAPIFFPAVRGNLVDGGAGVYGNPSLANAIEAVRYIGFAEEDILHISLGTGYTPNNKTEREGGRFWLLDWLHYLILEFLEDATLQQALATRAIFSKSDYRRYNPGLHPDNLMEIGIEAQHLNPLKLGLDARRPDEMELLAGIGKQYAEHIDWSLSNQMPWDTPGGRGKPAIQEIDWENSIYEGKP